MKKWNKINPLQYGIVIIFLINYNTLNMSKNGYLIPIINFILGFIPLFIFIKLLNYKPELNIYEKIDHIFNKIGFIINVLIGILIYILIISTYKELLDFIKINYLFNTNILLISIIISISLLYTCSKSLNVLFRLATLLFYIVFILFIVSILGLTNQIHINNLKNTSNINYVFYPMLSLFLLLMIPKKEILNNNKLTKHIIFFYIVGNVIKILIILFTILVLGIELASFYNFPEFMVLNKISTTGFFQRSDGIIGIKWIYIIFITLCIYFNYIKNLYKHIINKHTDLFIIILIIITSIICSI